MKKHILFILLLGMSYSSQAVFAYSPANQEQSNPKMFQRIVSYNFLSKDEIKNASNEIFKDLIVHVNEFKKVIIVKGIWKDISEFKTLIERIDKNKPTIRYSTHIIEINQNELKKLGIDWQQIMNHVASGKLESQQDFLNSISFLLSDGKAEILANPVVISLENEEASIMVGDRIPYVIPVDYGNSKTGWQLQYLDAGIHMRIKGVVISENIVETHLYSSINNVKQWKATLDGDYPVLSNREVTVLCQIKEGDTIIIGGLTSNNNRRNLNKIPILSDLPLIGDWFKSETSEIEKSEIVFLLTPEIKRM